MQIQPNLALMTQLGTHALSTPPSRVEFIKALKEFLEKHQVSLEYILVGKAQASDIYDDDTFISEEQLHLRQQFLSHPIIHDYLSRSSKFIDFEKNRPHLISDENNPDESDFYECKIYELAEKMVKTRFLPYRDNVLTDQFYKDGSVDTTIFKNISIKSKDCLIKKNGIDPYEIRDTVRRIEFGKYIDTIKNEYKDVRFIITPNCKDTHATSIISIIQKETFKHLASIFINSKKSENYFSFIESKFNRRGNVSIGLLNDTEALSFHNLISTKLQSKAVFKDLETKERYILKQLNLSNEENYEINDVNNAFDNKSIDVIHHFRYWNKIYYTLEGNRYVPLIDASHHLQLEEEDNNCLIYTYNFLQGIVNILENQEMADKIYELAEKIDSRNDAELSKETLATIFSENLKYYLPCYYNNGQQKSYDEIKQHHLHQRWDLGSQSMNIDTLKNLGYLR